MKKLLIISLIIFWTGFAWAEDKVINEKIKIKEDNQGKQYFEDKQGRKYDMQEIPLASNFTLKKPVIDETKLLDNDEKDLVEKTLKENGRRLIHTEVKPVKNDYKNDFDRGSVEYTTKARNYSFHKIIIPDGTTIKETNFSQKEPHTQAIEGKNLHFILCNLVNVEIDPTWILEGCNTCQIKNIKKSEENLGNNQKKIIVSHQVEQRDKTFKEVETNEITTNNTDDYNLTILRLNK